MKKLLLYTSVVLLVLSSVFMGILGSQEAVMLMTSSAIMALVLAGVLALMDRGYVWLLPCYIFVIITHALYLFASTSIAAAMVYVMAGAMFINCFALYLAWQKHVGCRMLLGLALVMKTCLLPEVVLNWMMFGASGQSTFLVFSLLLTLMTSCYAVAGMLRARGLRILKPALTPVLCVLEVIVIVDWIAALYAWIRVMRWQPAVQPASPAFEAKGVFASRRSRSKTVKPTFKASADSSSDQDSNPS